MHLSIRWKFILSIGITLLMTYLGLLSWDYWRQRTDASDRMEELVADRAENIANGLNSRLHDVQTVVENIAEGIKRQLPLNDAQIKPILGAFQRSLPPNTQIILAFVPQYAETANAQSAYRIQGGGRGGGGRGPNRGGGGSPSEGNRRGGRGETPSQNNQGPMATPVLNLNREQEPFYAKAVELKRPVWCDPHVINDGESQPRVTYSVPILNGDVVVAVVAAAFRPGQELLPFGGGRGGGRGLPGFGPPPQGSSFDGGRPDFGRGSDAARGPATEQATPVQSNPGFEAGESLGLLREFSIVGSQGQVILPLVPPGTERRSLIEWAEKNDRADLAKDLRAAIEGETSAVHVYRVKDVPDLIPGSKQGEYYWVAFAPVASSDWIVASAISESQYMDPIIQRLWHRALFLVGGLAILLAVTTIVSIRVSRPIERMASAVNQLAAGDLEARVRGVHSRDEIGQLAVAFNTMTGQLKTHIAALTKETAARETVEAELRIAREIQTDLLPRTFPPFPDRKEFELHAVNLPAKRVAGDFFDFFFSTGGLLTIVIADVSGKGMPAALLMAVTRTIVRNLAMEGLSPGQIIERANAMLVQDLSDSMFVTLFLCQYDTRTGAVTYVNAGHPPPYRISADGTPTPFGEVTGAILGVIPNGPDWLFDERREQLQPGETLLLFTDGVTEARSPSGSMLRNEGLEQLLTRFHDEPVQSLCARIVDEVNRYQNGQPVDDVTLLALRRQA